MFIALIRRTSSIRTLPAIRANRVKGSFERKSAVKKLYLLLAALLIAIGAPAIALAHPMDVTPLSNKDVLMMVEKKLTPEVIIQTIKTSPCTFDTFPSVMKELKRRGVPEEVLEAMIDAPYGPAEEKQATEDIPTDVATEQPIYHYTDSIKQYLAPVDTGRRYRPRTNRTRASRTPRYPR
jgi:hypothetical protein